MLLEVLLLLARDLVERCERLVRLASETLSDDLDPIRLDKSVMV